MHAKNKASPIDERNGISRCQPVLWIVESFICLTHQRIYGTADLL